MTLDLTEMARDRHSLLTITGHVIYDKCQQLSTSRPITFITPLSYITIPTWDSGELNSNTGVNELYVSGYWHTATVNCQVQSV